MRRWVGGLLLVAAVMSGCSGDEPDAAGDGAIPTDGVATSSETDVVTAPSPEDTTDPYCATVESVMSGERTTTDGQPGLLGAVQAYVDLRQAIEDMADTAPAELDDEYDSVRDTLGELPDLSDPLAAMAGALFTGIDLGIAFDRIDQVTEERCGLRPFTIDVESLQQVTTPYVDDDGYTVVDPRLLFGESWCDNGGSLLTALSPTMLVIDCGGGHYLGADLDAYEVRYEVRQQLPDTNVGQPSELIDRARIVDHRNGTITFAEVAVETASGFQGERRSILLRSVSLEDGSERFTVELPRPSGTIEELEVGLGGVRVGGVGPDGTMVVQYDWDRTDDIARVAYGIAPDGTVAWQQETFRWADVYGDYTRLSGPNYPTDVVATATGQSVVPEGVAGLEDGAQVALRPCATSFVVLSDEVTIVDGETGQVFVPDDPIAASARNFRDGTPHGFLFASRDDGYAFVNTDGVAWRVGPGLASSEQVRHGRLFLENQSGVLLEVDQATGQPISEDEATLPPTGVALDDGVLAQARGLGIRVRFEPMDVPCRG